MALQVENEQALQAVEKQLSATRGTITAAQAAAQTGLPLVTAEDALHRLLELYECRVSINEQSGDVAYIFAYPLRQRGTKTLAEKMVEWRKKAWMGFKYVYKASIGVVLLAYTAIFVVLLVAWALKGSDDDRDSNVDVGGALSLIFRLLAEAFYWHSWNQTMEYAIDPEGYQYRVYAAKEAKKGKKSIVKSAYDFVFGPEYPEQTEEQRAQETANYILSTNRTLTSSDLLLLHGGDYTKAESLLADAVARFKGDITLKESGAVVGDFSDFVRNAKSTLARKPTLYTEEAEPPIVHNGNTTGKNVGLIAMNTFNLVASFVGISISDGLLSIALGYFPLVFSVLFFTIPSVRLLSLPSRKKRRKEVMIQKKLLKTISLAPQLSWDKERLISNAGLTPEEQQLAEEILPRFVAELGGSLDIDANGRAICRFPRLARELAE